MLYLSNMKRLLIFTITVLCTVFCPSCCRMSEIDRAREMIAAGEAGCILLTGGKIAATNSGRGVNPLLEMHSQHRDLMPGAALVDKIIGRAAAFIAIDGGVRTVHALTISEDAIVLLQKHGIRVYYNNSTPRILNRDKSDLCPLEKSVAGVTDPAEAVRRLTETSRLLQTGNHHAIN